MPPLPARSSSFGLAELALIALRTVDRHLAEISEPKRPALARQRAPAALGTGQVTCDGFGVRHHGLIMAQTSKNGGMEGSDVNPVNSAETP
jgi:hypothetical protein